MIKVIFFDGDSVIYKEGFKPAIRQVEIRRGFSKGALYQSAHDRKYWKDFTLGRITEKEYLAKVAIDFLKNYKSKLNVRELQSLFSKNTKPIRGTLNLIKILKRKGQFKLGIISNNPKEWFFRIKRQFGLQGVFDVVAISGLTHTRKPDIRIFKYALNKSKAKAHESIYIDDRPERIAGASRLGMHIIIFKSARQLKKELNQLIKKENE